MRCTVSTDSLPHWVSVVYEEAVERRLVDGRVEFTVLETQLLHVHDFVCVNDCYT